MKVGDIKINKLQVVVLAILLIGIIAGVILVQRQQILKSRATQEIYNAFQSSDSEGNPLSCEGNVCETKDLDIKIKVDVDELERLANPD